MPTSQTRSSRRKVTRRTSITIRNVRLTAMLQPEDIIHRAETESGEEILGDLLRHLALNYGIGNFKIAFDEVIKSIETDFTNGELREGVLVPYARLEKVMEPQLAVATSEKGFLFNQFGDQRVYVIAVILVPIDMPGAYTQIMHGLEKSLPDMETARRVGAMNSALSVWQHFEEGGHRLPDHLQARHIMDTVRMHLHMNDTLKKAIDGFVKYNTPELPVLNASHELVGVVTLKRLVRICMPDYLMWVGDMNEFLNFEPLAEVVRNEAYTWIRDIMTVDFAQVDEDAPAIFAMKEIGQRETLNAYVLRGRKLVGIIRMLDFVKTVLR